MKQHDSEIFNKLITAGQICQQFEPCLNRAQEIEYQISQLEAENNEKLSAAGVVLHLCAYGVPMLLRQKKKKERAAQIESLKLEREKNLEQARNIYAANYDKFDMLPKEYHNSDAIYYMLKMMNDGRADNLKEAMAMFDEYDHRRRMEFNSEAALYQQQRNAEALEQMQRDISDIEWRTRWPYNS